MPWVRIDENAMDHPKIGTLPDGAFRLWVQGLAYCQKHLTDGLISAPFVRSLPAYSPKRRGELIEAGLWHVTQDGISIHDYLQWNDSKEEVTAKRKSARDRMRRSRERSDERCDERARERSPFVLRGVCITSSGSEDSEGGSGETMPAADPAAVRRFVDSHQQLHERFRGVPYIGNARKDYEAACALVTAFPDVTVQDAILTFGLNDSDPFMDKGSRTIPKIASQASKYAEELKAKKLA